MEERMGASEKCKRGNIKKGFNKPSIPIRER